MTASLPCNVWGAKHPVPSEKNRMPLVPTAMVGTAGSDPALNGGVNRLSATHSHDGGSAPKNIEEESVVSSLTWLGVCHAKPLKTPFITGGR